MSEQNISVRVNSARLPDFIGKTVRLACKVIQPGPPALVVASDDGEVTVQMLNPDQMPPDTYVEIVGTVVNPTTIKMLAAIPLGSELDMKLVNDTIELIHNPRFFSKMFS